MCQELITFSVNLSSGTPNLTLDQGVNVSNCKELNALWDAYSSTASHLLHGFMMGVVSLIENCAFGQREERGEVA